MSTQLSINEIRQIWQRGFWYDRGITIGDVQNLTRQIEAKLPSETTTALDTEALETHIATLRASLPTVNDGPDHKTWCAVRGDDLRALVWFLEALRK